MASTPKEGELFLDPGPKARRPISACKCCLWTGLVVIGLLALVAGYIVLSTAIQFINALRLPHKHMYINTTQPSALDVVKPLIDAEQRFDVAATVWIRDTMDKLEDEPDTDFATKVVLPPETPLFSDIILFNRSFADKEALTSVTFHVPIANLLVSNLSKHDLRVSFMLLPHSPSSLDHVANFSIARPHTEPLRPVRAWPFPLGSSFIGEKSVRDLATETLSTEVPLINIQNIYRSCPGQGSSSTDAYTNTLVDLNETSTSRLVVQPYITTRAHIRITDETQLLNKTSFDRAHQVLKNLQCNQTSQGANLPPACSRTYSLRGYWETRYELETQPNNQNEVSFAYGPFITGLQYPGGPKDLLPIPITHDSCNSPIPQALKVSDDGLLRITLQISVTSRTPGKMVMGDIFKLQGLYSDINKTAVVEDLNQTRSQDYLMQDMAEILNGVLGHRFREDSHPRRRIALIIIIVAFPVIDWFLLIHYWLTRASTVGISRRGTCLLLVGDVFPWLVDAMTKSENKDDGSMSSILVAFTIVGYLVVNAAIPVLAARIIWRVEIMRSSWRFWRWRFRQAQPTHKERAAEKTDKLTTWRAITGAVIFLASVLYLAPTGLYVILSGIPPQNLPSSHIYTTALLEPLWITGTVLQIIMNQRQHTFAGKHRLGAILEGIHQCAYLALFVPRFVGFYYAKEELTLLSLISAFISLTTAAQAVWFRSVPQATRSEEE